MGIFACCFGAGSLPTNPHGSAEHEGQPPFGKVGLEQKCRTQDQDSPSSHNGQAAAAPAFDLASKGPVALHRAEDRLAFRVLLQEGKNSVLAAENAFRQPALQGPSSPSTSIKLDDPELHRIRDQLLRLALSQRTGPDTFTRVQRLLAEARSWLLTTGSPHAAGVFLYTVGEALARVEFLLRSTGQVTFWEPDVVSAALALLQVYAILAQQAAGQQQGSDLLQSAMVRLLLGSPDILDLLEQLLELHHFNGSYLKLCTDQQELRSTTQALWQLLHGLVRFASRTLSSGSAWQGVQGGKGTASAANIIRSCLDRATGLLLPGSGIVARVCDEPLSPTTAAPQLAALRLLKHLYELPGEGPLHEQDIAEHWTLLHWRMFHACYAAAGVDAGSGAAELGKMHLKLLVVMAMSGAPHVRAKLHALGAAALLLSEFTLEAQLLSVEQMQAAAGAEDGGSYSMSEGDTNSEADISRHNSSSAEEQPQDNADRGATGALESNSKDLFASTGVTSTGVTTSSQLPQGPLPAPRGIITKRPSKDLPAQQQGTSTAQPPHSADPSAPGAAVLHSGRGSKAKGSSGRKAPAPKSQKFTFTYDLNEDVERLLELEDDLGHEVTLDGLGYDDEGKALLARSQARAEAMARAAAAVAPAPVGSSAASARAAGDGASGAGTGSAPAGPTQPKSPAPPPLTVPPLGQISRKLSTPKIASPFASADDNQEVLSPPDTPALASSPPGQNPAPAAAILSARSTRFAEEAAGGAGTDRELASKSSVPKLSLGSLRSAASSRLGFTTGQQQQLHMGHVSSARSNAGGTQEGGGRSTGRASLGTRGSLAHSLSSLTTGGHSSGGAAATAGEGDQQDQLHQIEQLQLAGPLLSGEDEQLGTSPPSPQRPRLGSVPPSPPRHGAAPPTPSRLQRAGGSGAYGYASGGPNPPAIPRLSVPPPLAIAPSHGMTSPGAPASDANGNLIHTHLSPLSARGSLPVQPSPRGLVGAAWEQQGTAAQGGPGGPTSPDMASVMAAGGRAPRGSHGAGSSPGVSRLGRVSLQLQRESAGVHSSPAGQHSGDGSQGTLHGISYDGSVPLIAPPSPMFNRQSGAGLQGAYQRVSAGDGSEAGSQVVTRNHTFTFDSLAAGSSHLASLPTAMLRTHPSDNSEQGAISSNNNQQGGRHHSSATAVVAVNRSVDDVLSGSNVSEACDQVPELPQYNNGSGAVSSARGAGSSHAPGSGSGGPVPAPPLGPAPGSARSRGSQAATPTGGVGVVPSLNLLSLRQQSRGRAGQYSGRGDGTSGAPLTSTSRGETLSSLGTLHTAGGSVVDSAMNFRHLPPSPAALSPHPASDLSPSAWPPVAHRGGLSIWTPPQGSSAEFSAVTSQDNPGPVGTSSSAQGDGSVIGSPTAYSSALRSKLWYYDKDLHADLLLLLLHLLVTPSGGVDPVAVQVLAVEAGVMNFEHTLAWHFAGPPGMEVLKDLLQAQTRRAALQQQRQGQGLNTASAPPGFSPVAASTQGLGCYAQHTVRLLRLLSRQLFDPGCYCDLVFHSRGANGAVFRAKMKVPPVDPGNSTAAGTAALPPPPQQVMIKVIELPSSGYDSPNLAEVFGEVSIMERFALCCAGPSTSNHSIMGDPAPATPNGMSSRSNRNSISNPCTPRLPNAAGHPGICQMLDYGLAPDAYWIVMQRYRCSLNEWRARQQGGPTQPRAAALYLAVLAQVAEALQVLASASVVHFDLKTANVLIQPHEGVTDGKLWGPPPPPPCEPPFRAVLADFGEARAYRSAEEAYTARNRGTEVYKSPEMLMMNAGGSSGNTSYQPGLSSTLTAFSSTVQSARPSGNIGAASASPMMRRGTTANSSRTIGAGLASDIWSFGCLCYELLSGKPLFGQADYASITHRVAFGGGPHLMLTPAECDALGGRDGPGAGFVSLVEWVLARNPETRPRLPHILARLSGLRDQQLQLAAQRES